MKKKLLFLAALVLASLQLSAANVDLTTAQQSAQRFLMSQAAKGRFMATPPSVKWTQEVKNSSNPALTAFYIVNTDNGYVIVSGDDRGREVLAYSDGPLETLNDLPEAVEYFLDIYKKQIEYLQAHPGMKVQKPINRGGTSVPALLTSAWSQGKPYNMKTPKKGTGNDPYCKVGCSAVALAQVMYYWKYPDASPALPGYTCPNSGYVIEDLPEYNFDWDNMQDTYPTTNSGIDQLSDTKINAIAWFMRYVGQAETMDYGLVQSGAERDQIMDALRTFGYRDARIVMKWDFDDGTVNYTEEAWGELIQSELRAGRPLIYCAFDMSSDSTGIGGHAFNVDGYDADNDMYHVNFGMSADKNTYYALNNFTLDNGMTVYDFYPILFADVQDPSLTNDPHIYTSTGSVNLECYAGETTTATFNVSSANLTGDITVTVTDANNVFSVDVTKIPLAEVNNKTVTVTYAPQEIGTHTATITLSSDGAQDVTVSLSGTATAAPLVKKDPVMQPADSAYINLTSFRANWTDSTAVDNVLSYTLEVSEKPAAPTGLLTEVDWSELPKMNGNQASHATDYLPEGWGYSGYDFYLDGGCVEIGTEDVIMTNSLDLSGCDKVTVVFRGKNYYDWKDSPVKISTSVDSEEFDLATDYADYYVVLNCGDVERIKIEATDGMIHIQGIQVYAGEMTAPEMREVVETGDTAYRLITGITDKFYTVTNLTAEGTYNYKVKALYADGTESDWSNVEQVTLFANTPAHDYGLGDYNHDRLIDIEDATMMINDLLYNTNDGCPICGDLNHDNKIDIEDATALINVLLFGWE